MHYIIFSVWEIEFRKFIASYLSDAKQRNHKFSQRALAKKLHISSSTLSELISGNRHVTASKALKMLAQLGDVDESKRTGLESKILSVTAERIQLDQRNYDLILDWIFIGILCLFELDSPPRTSKEIANLLGVKLSRIDDALKRLVESGMIRETSDGFLLEHKHFETTNDIPDSRIVKAHVDGLEKAKEAVTEIPADARDFISLAITGDSRKLKATKQLVRRFLQQVSRTLTGTRRDEVFKVNVQIFPVTTSYRRKAEK